jgi:hypothetical protein
VPALTSATPLREWSQLPDDSSYMKAAAEALRQPPRALATASSLGTRPQRSSWAAVLDGTGSIILVQNTIMVQTSPIESRKRLIFARGYCASVKYECGHSTCIRVRLELLMIARAVRVLDSAPHIERQDQDMA